MALDWPWDELEQGPFSKMAIDKVIDEKIFFSNLLCLMSLRVLRAQFSESFGKHCATATFLYHYILFAIITLPILFYMTVSDGLFCHYLQLSSTYHMYTWNSEWIFLISPNILIHKTKQQFWNVSDGGKRINRSQTRRSLCLSFIYGNQYTPNEFWTKWNWWHGNITYSCLHSVLLLTISYLCIWIACIQSTQCHANTTHKGQIVDHSTDYSTLCR